jgi:hypothetical protein
MVPSQYAISLLIFVNVATDAPSPPPPPPTDDVFGWGKSQFNPVGMNLQTTVQLLAPAPGRRSLIWHGNHGNQVCYYCGAGPVAERERERERERMERNAGNSGECGATVAQSGGCGGNDSIMLCG